jgi:hypothetical protein
MLLKQVRDRVVPCPSHSLIESLGVQLGVCSPLPGYDYGST